MWTGKTSDMCLQIFLACQRQWGMEIAPGSTILEIGCSEANWMALARENVPAATIVGVDCRETPWKHLGHVYQCDLRDLPNHESVEGRFDWVVLVSTLEHIGLGYYGDPTFDDGDFETLSLCASWMKPGGQLYFDVPWSPPPGEKWYRGGSGAVNARIYDEARLQRLRGSLWSEQAVSCFKEPHRGPFMYRAHWWMKNGETGSV